MPVTPSSWSGIVAQVLFPIIMCLLFYVDFRVIVKGQQRAFNRIANAFMLVYVELHETRTGKKPDTAGMMEDFNRKKETD